MQIHRWVAALMIPVVAGCSAFMPADAPLTVRSNVDGANVLVNGERVGETPMTVRLRRGKKYGIAVEQNGRRNAGYVGRRISSVGIVDIVGGAFFLVPFIGLATPGAWDLDPNVLYLPLDSEVAS